MQSRYMKYIPREEGVSFLQSEGRENTCSFYHLHILNKRGKTYKEIHVKRVKEKTVGMRAREDEVATDL